MTRTSGGDGVERSTGAPGAAPDEAITLALDASTSVGSTAVLRGRTVLAEVDVPLRARDAERLLPAVDDAIRASGAGLRSITRIACGGGPGSFTGLRIAGAIGRGLAVSLRVPLLPVPTHLLLVAGARVGPGRYLALLDAMRGERFARLIDVSEHGVPGIASAVRLLSVEEAAEEAARLGATRIGPGEEIDATPHARGAVLVLEATSAATAVALDGWEPDYGRLAEAQVRWEAAHGRPLG